DVRLVTLTGAGGTGKTRLALRIAAASVERFKNGVFVVWLAAITDPQLILPTIAQTVGVKLSSAPGEDLARHLAGKSMLLLLRSDVRLVTLTGAGGTGKTRLALRIAAASVERFKNGVFVVWLAAITDPQLILPTIAQTVGVKLSSAPGEDLARHLAGKSMLLLL